MSTAVIGVDPGATGAIAYLSADHVDVADLPVIDGTVDAGALRDIIIGWGPVDRVAVEQVAARPGAGVSGMFKFGRNYGTILGVVACLDRPLIHVTPTVWTKATRVGADKDAHRRRCIELWPANADLWRRKKDDGRADAALIAWWACCTLEGRQAA